MTTASGHTAQTNNALRGYRLFRAAESIMRRLESGLHHFIPPGANPFAHAGPLANFFFLVALGSGILLLIWYKPSLHEAHASLETLAAGGSFGTWLGQAVRSIHRYSSDAFIFFVLVHAVRIFITRKFTGGRWLAWVSGWVLLALGLLIGWLGYALVWDGQAKTLLQTGARYVDILPVFQEPVRALFLTNDSVPSLLFFLIFFTHMLLPLAFGLGMYVHLMRVARPMLLPGRTLAVASGLAVLIWSLLLPAHSGAPAEAHTVTDSFDLWYSAPVIAARHLGTGAGWGLGIAASTLLLSIPWWLPRRLQASAQQAEVVADKCTGCTLCANDCPFGAITMKPSESDKAPGRLVAEVNHSICMGCGICAGSCDFGAIGLDDWDVMLERRRIEQWIDAKTTADEKPYFAFLCGGSSGRDLPKHSEERDLPGMEGYQVRVLPCSGWMNPKLIEHALSRGAGGVLIGGCGSTDPAFRDGADIMRQRLEGERKPPLRRSVRETGSVLYVGHTRSRPDQVADQAREFRQGRQSELFRERQPLWIRGLASVLLAAVLSLAIWSASSVPIARPNPDSATWTVYLVGRGPAVYRDFSTGADARPVHMRPTKPMISHHLPVRLQIEVDGEIRHDREYKASGIKSNGPAIALLSLPLEPGSHTLRVTVSGKGKPPETPDLEPRAWEQSLDVVAGQDVVLRFDENNGFRFEAGTSAPAQ